VALFLLVAKGTVSTSRLNWLLKRSQCFLRALQEPVKAFRQLMEWTAGRSCGQPLGHHSILALVR
jgi:hypothetical protein